LAACNFSSQNCLSPFFVVGERQGQNFGDRILGTYTVA
jgi:hypothetical protein